jgi:nicotinamide mononucleotide transporter
LYGGTRHTRLLVSRARRVHWLVLVPFGLVGGLALGAILDRYTDSPLPYFDALLTSASLVAQWMMTRKLLENWIIWIVADVVYVPVFIQRGLPFTAVQYAVFLVLAFMGWASWRQSLRTQPDTPAAA